MKLVQQQKEHQHEQLFDIELKPTLTNSSNILVKLKTSQGGAVNTDSDQIMSEFILNRKETDEFHLNLTLTLDADQTLLFSFVVLNYWLIVVAVVMG